MVTELLFGLRKVLEVDGGNDCTTLWIWLIPLNCTLRNGLNGKFYVIHILLWFKKINNIIYQDHWIVYQDHWISNKWNLWYMNYNLVKLLKSENNSYFRYEKRITLKHVSSYLTMQVWVCFWTLFCPNNLYFYDSNTFFIECFCYMFIDFLDVLNKATIGFIILFCLLFYWFLLLLFILFYIVYKFLGLLKKKLYWFYPFFFNVVS